LRPISSIAYATAGVFSSLISTSAISTPSCARRDRAADAVARTRDHDDFSIDVHRCLHWNGRMRVELHMLARDGGTFDVRPVHRPPS
jgi:hypothetical protein